VASDSPFLFSNRIHVVRFYFIKTFVFVADCVFSLVERFGYQMLCGQNSESQACRIRLFFWL